MPHSAMATLTAGFYIGILISEPALAWPAAAAKAVLYAVRVEHPQSHRALAAIPRVLVGLIIPCVALASSAIPVSVAMIADESGNLPGPLSKFPALGILFGRKDLARVMAVEKV